MYSQVKPFGFRIAKHYKRRLAKKLIKSRGRNMWERYKYFTNHRGLISDCSGLNAKPIKIIPVYIGDHKAKVLWDLDIESTTNSCSFYHCGVDKPKSYTECKQYIKYIIDTYKKEDSFNFAKRYSKLTLNPDGTFEW